jgi:phenylacetic acid degradation operon negative regulatory protein
MAQTQNLILRIVAQRGEISNGELLRTAQRFGRSPDAIRAAANRMARAGLLTKVGHSRGNLRYQVGPQGQAIIQQFVAKIVRWHIALDGLSGWDRNWLVVTFSVPEIRRGRRDAFRSWLAETGFGLLSSSVWISPFDQEADVIAKIEELDITGLVALMRCQRMWLPGLKHVGDLACRVWQLDTLASRYRDLNNRVEALLASLERVKRGTVVDAEAIFFEAMDLEGELIDIILSEDPCLPAELLPENWPSQHTHELIHTLIRAVDRIESLGDSYEYLFHLIQGMEVLEAFRMEGDDSLYWPGEEEARR